MGRGGNGAHYLEDTIERIKRPQTKAALFGEFDRIVNELGFDRYTLAIVPRDPRLESAPIFQTTIADEFTQLYLGHRPIKGIPESGEC